MKYRYIKSIILIFFLIGLSNLQAQTVKDIDGNAYKTVSIGFQEWMAENLKTTKYNDGFYIPEIPDGSWTSLTSPGFCWYENNLASYKGPFGALYNWYAVNTGKLCPTGWHVPSNSEWTTLTSFMGGENIAAGKLRESGNSLWLAPDKNTTNSSEFTARPSGARDPDGTFHSVSTYCGFWSSTEGNKDEALARDMQNDINEVGSGSVGKKTGFSVRCIKNK